MDQYLSIGAALDGVDVTVLDREYVTYSGDTGRIVEIGIGRVRLMVGGSDETRIAALGRLIAAAEELRDAATIRQAKATLPDGVEFVGTVGAFLDGWAPGEVTEAFGS